MARLKSIAYKPEGVAETGPAYARVAVQEARLEVGRGIVGDVKGLSSQRELNIMSAETIATLEAEGFQVMPGQLGEQLVVEGLVVDGLPQGTRLQIGPIACVEIAKPRTGCTRFAASQGRPQEDAAGRMGVIANVRVGGPIRVGDAVTLIGEA